MKKLLTIALILIPVGVMAQTATANGSSSTSTTSALGNNQAVTFMSSSPSEITTNANVNSTSHNTNNIINSGTTTSIVDYRGEYTIKNVPSVSGPPLTTSNDTCMGSTTGSANGAGFGLSFGSTWSDDHCKRLKMSRELWNKGMKAASLAMDCMDEGARAALEMTGTKCPQSMTIEERRAAFGPVMPAPAQALATLPSSPTAPKPEAATSVASHSKVPSSGNVVSIVSSAPVLAVIPSPVPRAEPVEPMVEQQVPLNGVRPADITSQRLTDYEVSPLENVVQN